MEGFVFEMGLDLDRRRLGEMGTGFLGVTTLCPQGSIQLLSKGQTSENRKFSWPQLGGQEWAPD